jgi:hypothetical protein
MGVDQNGRDTRYPDSGPDVGTGYPTGTVGTDQFYPDFKKAVSTAAGLSESAALEASNTEKVTGLPFHDSHVPMGPSSLYPTGLPTGTTETTTSTALDKARAAARAKKGTSK